MSVPIGNSLTTTANPLLANLLNNSPILGTYTVGKRPERDNIGNNKFGIKSVIKSKSGIPVKKYQIILSRSRCLTRHKRKPKKEMILLEH